MSKRRSSKKRIKRSTKRNLVAVLVILLIAVAGFFYIRDIEWKEEEEMRAMRVKNELYTTLENRDSLIYIENIELGRNTDILLLSKIFYKNELFWPYIFEVNNKIENPLDIPKGTVIKIPKVSPELLDITSEKNMERVKSIGDSILYVIQESRKPRPIE